MITRPKGRGHTECRQNHIHNKYSQPNRTTFPQFGWADGHNQSIESTPKDAEIILELRCDVVYRVLNRFNLIGFVIDFNLKLLFKRHEEFGDIQ